MEAQVHYAKPRSSLPDLRQVPFPYVPIFRPCSHFLEWQTVFQLSASQKEIMSNPKKIQADTIR